VVRARWRGDLVPVTFARIFGHHRSFRTAMTHLSGMEK
jgi:hypothetical protein